MPARPFSAASVRPLALPVTLAGLVVWCSAHALPRWGEPSYQTDKLEHIIVFGLIAALLARARLLTRFGPSGAYAILVLVSGFGFADELHQNFTPGRSMDAFDWAADTLGAALGVALYVRWPRFRRFLEVRFPKRRVEIAGGPCLIAADGFSLRSATDR